MSESSLRGWSLVYAVRWQDSMTQKAGLKIIGGNYIVISIPTFIKLMRINKPFITIYAQKWPRQGVGAAFSVNQSRHSGDIGHPWPASGR